MRNEFLQNSILSRDGRVKNNRNKEETTETRKRLPYYGTMEEKNDNTSTLHLLHIQQV